MTRATYVYRDGQMVLKAEAPPRQSGPYVFSDIAPFVTAGDRVAISSRSHLRAYEQANGVKQIGNDIKPPRLAGEHE